MQSKSKIGQSSGSNTNSYNSGTKSLTVTASNYKAAAPMGNLRENARNSSVRPGARLTSKEVEERRSKGLCFWCEEKYTPNHHCPKRRAFVLQMIEDDEEEEMGARDEEVRERDESAAELQLSLHALWGIEGNQIMRVKGSYQKKALRVLIDTGSTHNFLSSRVAEKIHCELMEVKPAAVEVANGQQLECTQKCKEFEWEMQGNKFKAEVHVIWLETYDLILGVQWLSPLGDIAWNFNTLQMKFKVKGKEIILTGERWPLKDKQLSCLALVSHQEEGEEGQRDEFKLSKLIAIADAGVPFASCCEIRKEELWPELNQLLLSFADIFKEPTELPPQRAQDHQIRL